MPKASIAVERSNAKESYERAQILQPILDGGSSKTPASVSVERRDSSELFCGLVADHMGYRNLCFSMWGAMWFSRFPVPSSRTIRNHMSS